MLKIRAEQVAALRKDRIAEGLMGTLRDTPLSPSRDQGTGDVLATDLKGNSTRFGFDQQGFVGSVTSPLGRVWRMENDAEGKPLAMSNPAGLRLRFAYDENKRPLSVSRDKLQLARFLYEPGGSPTEIVHVDGSATRIAYFDPKRVSAITNRLGVAEGYEYDERGALIAITDANRNRTEFRNDERGRVVEARYADGSSERYAYSPEGALRSIASGGRNVVRITGSSLIYGDRGAVFYAYDPGGRVTEARTQDISCRYRYNAEGRVTEEDQGGQVIRYGYDASGTLTTLTYPSGEQTTFAYDADLRLETVTDWSGGAHRFQYATGDRAISLYAPNDVTTVTHYSENALPVAIAASGGRSTQGLFDFRYDYDDEDRVRVFRDSTSLSRNYDYDAEGRLLAVRSGGAGLDERFAYDKVGNRTRTNDGEARFNSLNQLTSQGSRRCRYDARGNMIEISGDAGWRYTYNDRNELVRADGPTGQSVTFAYDAFGRRIRKRSGAAEVRYVWAGEQMVREIRTENGRTRVQDYLYIPGTFTPLATRINGEIYCCHTDHLGRVSRLTDASGAVAWSSDFTAFGEGKLQSVRVPFPLRLPGQYFDEETGLHYNRFRYYSPALGRYLSRDPVTYLSGLNFYTYANNDPINSADPTGLWTWAGVAKIAAVAVVSIAVAAAVVAFAPIALPLAIVAAGAAAGAVGGALSTMLDGNFSLKCIGESALKGAAVGIIAALPFAFLPAAAGVAAYAATGAVSGALGYTAGFAADYPNAHWSWGQFATSVALGGVLAGAGRYLAAKWQSRSAAEPTETQTATQEDLEEIYQKAPAAKEEIDGLADDVAQASGGKVAKAPLKSPERALQKINNDYGGDVNRIKDVARNTVVVPSGREDGALQTLLEARPDIDPKSVKIINPAEDPLGYSGMNVSVPTEAGIPGEIQINSPEMIYAKELPERARSILGDDQFNQIASRPDLPPGGQGHGYYEEWQSLPPGSPERDAIAAKSKAYYDAFRR